MSFLSLWMICDPSWVATETLKLRHPVSMGKIFHNHLPDVVSFDEPDLKPAEYMTPEMIDRDAESFYYDKELNKELAEVRERRLAKNPNAYADGWAYGRSTENSDAPDDAFYDGAQTDLAIETLKRLKDRDEPFFLALGYYRPHLSSCGETTDGNSANMVAGVNKRTTTSMFGFPC